tara:strand:+ start:1073 stop:2014 length:942 start_codon:yes stop_codon:yes gene_type:complete
MSIATLKRKSAVKYSNNSGRGKSSFIINKGSCNTIHHFDNNSTSKYSFSKTSTGGGFSINGKHRNNSWVGQDMRMSKGLSRAKNVSNSRNHGRVPQYKGSGGIHGRYNRVVSGKFGIRSRTEDDIKVIKPSVITTKGLLYYKTRWTKRPINKERLTDIFNTANISINDKSYPPRYDMVQLICNNWVQNTGTGNIQNNTQSQYIQDTIKPKNQICNPNRYSDVPKEGQSLKKKCNGYHIGGKYYQYQLISKQTKDIPTSSSYIYNIKYNKGLLRSSGWQNPWPVTKNNYTCMNDRTQILYDVVNRSNQEKFLCQ